MRWCYWPFAMYLPAVLFAGSRTWLFLEDMALYIVKLCVPNGSKIWKVESRAAKQLRYEEETHE